MRLLNKSKILIILVVAYVIITNHVKNRIAPRKINLKNVLIGKISSCFTFSECALFPHHKTVHFISSESRMPL